MPLVIPIGGAATNSVEVVSPALASFEIARTREQAPGLGAMQIRGQLSRPALSCVIIRGIGVRASLSSVDAGEVQTGAGAGSLDAGGVREASGLGAIETRVLTLRASLITLDVGNSGTLGATEARAWASLMALTVGGDATSAALAAEEIRGQAVSAGLGALSQERDVARSAHGSLATSKALIATSLAAVDAGLSTEAEGLGAIEIEAAEGIDIVVDIVDEIIGTGRGDVC